MQGSNMERSCETKEKRIVSVVWFVERVEERTKNRDEVQFSTENRDRLYTWHYYTRTNVILLSRARGIFDDVFAYLWRPRLESRRNEAERNGTSAKEFFRWLIRDFTVFLAVEVFRCEPCFRGIILFHKNTVYTWWSKRLRTVISSLLKINYKNNRTIEFFVSRSIRVSRRNGNHADNWISILMPRDKRAI